MASLRAPAHSYEDIRGIADQFLRQHNPEARIPVPIEEIVEFRLGINIIPLPGLHVGHEIDGFLSADMTELSVDLFVFESRPARYRFTLAHEVGHIVLHRDLLREAMPTSIPDWKEFVFTLSEKDRQWLEWQAYAFGGLVLVPRDPLAADYQDVLRLAYEQGIDIEAEIDIARDYVATHIAKRFSVSAAVVEKRLVYDDIWPK